MKDLFAPVAQFARIDMPDADVEFSPNFRMPQSNEHLFQQLCESTTWRHEEVVVYGRRHLQPRLTAWYGDPGKSYTYSGTVMTPLPWTDVLLDLKRELEERVETRFNSVLLNLYRNENDRMGFHSDNERSLGKEPTIASLSYGATRTLKFKHRSVRISASSSCCLRMGASC